MNRKDRVAVVLSIMYIIILLITVGAEGIEAVGVFGIPLFIYWAYRFIKNDISFLKVKEKID